MQTYILCGGLGTRLRSVISNGQKALADINGRPFLALVLEQLKLAGIKEAVLCAGYRADQIANALDELAQTSELDLKLVVESSPLGTGGALLNAFKQHPTTSPLMVLNADTFLDCNAYRLIQETEARAAILAVWVADRSRFGSLVCDTTGKVLGMHEKGLTGPGFINGGVYILPPDTLAEWPLVACSIERDILPSFIKKGHLHVAKHFGIFRDIGTQESLAAFKFEASL